MRKKPKLATELEYLNDCVEGLFLEISVGRYKTKGKKRVYDKSYGLIVPHIEPRIFNSLLDDMMDADPDPIHSSIHYVALNLARNF